MHSTLTLLHNMKPALDTPLGLCYNRDGGESMLYRLSIAPLPDVTAVGHIKYQHGWFCDYCHKMNVLIYVLAGEFIFDLAEIGRVSVRSGAYILIPGGTSYRVRAGDDCEFYYIHFSAAEPLEPVDDEQALSALLSEVSEQRRALDGAYSVPYSRCIYLDRTRSLNERGEAVRYRLSRCEEYRYGHDALDRLRMINSFFNLLLTISSTTSGHLLDTPRQSSTLLKLTRYIDENYTLPISLDDLSDRFGLSKQYIMRLFRTQLGTTVSRYVNTVKLRKSLDMLRLTGLSVSEIAYSLGYSGSYYFCRLFKQYFSLTPTEYQRSHPKNEGGDL